MADSGASMVTVVGLAMMLLVGADAPVGGSNQPLSITEPPRSPPTSSRTYADPLVDRRERLAALPRPTPEDGLEGNRQISLSPFPNLDIQSGPLAVEQLPWIYPRDGWAHAAPIQTLEFQSMMGIFETNGLDDADFGWHNSLQFAVPFWKDEQIGAQVGIGFEPTTYPQMFMYLTAGVFHRAVWEDIDPSLKRRLSWGVVFDGLYDSEIASYLSQVRGQVGVALRPDREAGLWFALHIQDDIGTSKEQPIDYSFTNQIALFCRQALSESWEGKVFGGVIEAPGETFAGAELSFRATEQMNWFVNGYTNLDPDGGWAIYVGLRWKYLPIFDQTRLFTPEWANRPYLPMGDHLNMQLRRRLR